MKNINEAMNSLQKTKRLNESFKVSELKKKAQEILPKEDIDTHDGDLYLKVTPESTELLNNMLDKDSGLLSKFKSEIDGKMWYDIPFANMEDDFNKSENLQEDTGTKEGHNKYIDSEKEYWTNDIWSKKAMELEELINTLNSIRGEVRDSKTDKYNNVDFKYLTQYLSKAQTSLNSALRLINTNKNTDWDSKKIN